MAITSSAATPAVISLPALATHTSFYIVSLFLRYSEGLAYLFISDSAIDRFWWTWQNLKPQDRTYVVGFTRTFNNTPPSDPATLDDPVELGAVGLAGEFTIRSLSSSIKGGGSPFCYIYA